MRSLRKCKISSSLAWDWAGLIMRDDGPINERATLIPAAVEASRPTPNILGTLLEAVDSVAWPDPDVIKPVLTEYLTGTQKTGRSPGSYHWIARDERAG